MITSARTARTPRPPDLRLDPPAPIDLAPISAYEAVTRQMVEHLAADLREIKRRLDGLLWMVAGALVLEFALRLIDVT
ncbi:MAG: hypothetical protein ACRDJW_07590 [Thermomicrobiales bacterium]